MPGRQDPGRTASAKVTRRLLPFLFPLYVVCFLDRVLLHIAACATVAALGFLHGA